METQSTVNALNQHLFRNYARQERDNWKTGACRPWISNSLISNRESEFYLRQGGGEDTRYPKILITQWHAFIRDNAAGNKLQQNASTFRMEARDATTKTRFTCRWIETNTRFAVLCNFIQLLFVKTNVYARSITVSKKNCRQFQLDTISWKKDRRTIHLVLFWSFEVYFDIREFVSFFKTILHRVAVEVANWRPVNPYPHSWALSPPLHRSPHYIEISSPRISPTLSNLIRSDVANGTKRRKL